MSKLTKAIDTIKDQTWPGLRHASIGDTIDAISRSGEWTAFEVEEDNDDGFTAVREGNIIVDFSGKDNNGDKVNIQWVLSDDDMFGVCYAEVDGEALEEDEKDEYFAGVAAGMKENGLDSASGSGKSGGSKGGSKGAGRSGSKHGAPAGGRRAKSANDKAFAIWCEENGYEVSEEYWEEYVEVWEEYEEYEESEEYDDDDYDDDDDEYDDDEDDHKPHDDNEFVD